MSNSFKFDNDNQFLTQNVDDFKMKASRSMSTQQMISKMEQKNYTLKKQVTKIQRVLSSMKVQQKPRYGISLPQIKPDALKKQLQNAYKHIKIYQYQVEKRRNAVSNQAAYVQQLNKIERVYKQKIQIHERLKRQMINLKHESKQLTKQLKNDVKKLSYENLENKLTTDIKYLQEQLRQMEIKRTTHIMRLQAQRKTIKQIQAEILKQNSHQTLEIMKNRIFKSANVQRDDGLSPSRAIVDIQNQAAKQQSRVSKIQIQAQEELQKSPQSYTSFQNQAKLLKKLQTDYEQKINLITKQRDQASQKNFRSRNKILQIEYEIQTIEKNIGQLKKLIDPNIFKPKLPKKEEKQSPKKKELIILHSYKNIQTGVITKNGKRFSDRSIIGRVNSKIVGVTLYERQNTKEFVGFQATYKIQDQKATIRKGNVNIRIDMKKEPFKQQNLKLQGEDYLKSIDVFVKKGKIQGISIVSFYNKTLKLGDVSGQRVCLTMKQTQYPMCLYGSLLMDGFQCLGVQINALFEKTQQN